MIIINHRGGDPAIHNGNAVSVSRIPIQAFPLSGKINAIVEAPFVLVYAHAEIGVHLVWRCAVAEPPKLRSS
jgi:hypothetical protein